MDFKRNALFFNHKKTKFWTFFTYVAYFFIVLSVIVYLLTAWLPFALPFAVIGVAILLTALSMITSEKQLKEQIALLQNGAKDAALEHFGYPNQDPDLFFEFEAYDLTDRSLPIRKKRNGRVFSTAYNITYLMIENNCLRTWEKKGSLVDDKEIILTKDIPFADLSGAEVFTETTTRLCIDGKEKEVPVIALLVKDKDNNTVVTASNKIITYDMERFSENLAHLIKRTAENANK